MHSLRTQHVRTQVETHEREIDQIIDFLSAATIIVSGKQINDLFNKGYRYLNRSMMIKDNIESPVHKILSWNILKPLQLNYQYIGGGVQI